MVSLLELSPDKSGLTVVAGLGWRPGTIGELVVDASAKGSQSGYTLATGGPVIVTDFADEKRFTVTPSLIEEGAKSGMTVRIGGPDKSIRRPDRVHRQARPLHARRRELPAGRGQRPCRCRCAVSCRGGPPRVARSAGGDRVHHRRGHHRPQWQRDHVCQRRGSPTDRLRERPGADGRCDGRGRSVRAIRRAGSTDGRRGPAQPQGDSGRAAGGGDRRVSNLRDRRDPLGNRESDCRSGLERQHHPRDQHLPRNHW